MSYPIGVKHTDETRTLIRGLYSGGLSLNAVAARTGISGGTVFKWCRGILRTKSAAATGHIKSEQHRLHLSAALSGRKASAEAKLHQSIAHRRRGTVPPSQKGKIPWNYRGVTPQHERIRKSAEYIDWRNKVFRRDNYTCQACGSRGGVLRAHHVKAFSTYPELRLVVDNGLTLCAACHVRPGVHGG